MCAVVCVVVSVVRAECAVGVLCALCVACGVNVLCAACVVYAVCTVGECVS